nr:putative retrotransposon protein [Tanacetum cinerariifolium]
SGSHTFHEASGSNVGLELLKELDTQPLNETSEQHDEVKHNEVEPRSQKVHVRLSERIPQEPDRYGFYVDVEEHKLGDLNEPHDYKSALSYPEYDKWVDAMNVKMQSMKDNQEKQHTSLESRSYVMDLSAILKYLRNIKDMVLVYGGNPENELKVTSYTNGSFQTDKDDTKSQSRYVFVLNGGAVEWKSAKQSTIAISSIEFEYVVVAKPSMKVVWMRKFIDELGNVVPTNKRPMKMLCDNTTAIVIANDPGITKGARHYQRKYHYIR